MINCVYISVKESLLGFVWWDEAQNSFSIKKCTYVFLKIPTSLLGKYEDHVQQKIRKYYQQIA